MLEYLKANPWLLTATFGGVTTIWTLIQYRAKKREEQEKATAVAVSVEHRFTILEVQGANHESRLVRLEGLPK